MCWDHVAKLVNLEAVAHMHRCWVGVGGGEGVGGEGGGYLCAECNLGIRVSQIVFLLPVPAGATPKD